MTSQTWEQRFEEQFQESEMEDGWGNYSYVICTDKANLKNFIQSELSQQRKEIEEKEICICSAIKSVDDYVIRGHRHSDCFNTMRQIPRYADQKAYDWEQGFITSKNRFVTREEGRKLQDEAGIESADPTGYREGTLFSEDLY